jgi:hypothetical protein
VLIFIEKVELFKDTFFPIPLDVDLIDINRAIYSTLYENLSIIIIKEVRTVIKVLNAYKALG